MAHHADEFVFEAVDLLQFLIGGLKPLIKARSLDDDGNPRRHETRQATLLRAQSTRCARPDHQHAQASLFDAQRKIQSLFEVQGADDIVLFPAGDRDSAFVRRRFPVPEDLGERHLFGETQGKGTLVEG